MAASVRMVGDEDLARGRLPPVYQSARMLDLPNVKLLLLSHRDYVMKHAPQESMDTHAPFTITQKCRELHRHTHTSWSQIQRNAEAVHGTGGRKGGSYTVG